VGKKEKWIQDTKFVDLDYHQQLLSNAEPWINNNSGIVEKLTSWQQTKRKEKNEREIGKEVEKCGPLQDTERSQQYSIAKIQANQLNYYGVFNYWQQPTVTSIGTSSTDRISF